jgi:hypothetical protein
MKKSLPFLLWITVFSLSASAQSLPPGHPPADMMLPPGPPSVNTKLPADHPAVDTKQETVVAPDAVLTQKARVLSTIDAAPYTYLEVEQNNETIWLAANGVQAKKGDVVRFDEGAVMTNFHSQKLNRTFPSVIFVSYLVVTEEKK